MTMSLRCPIGALGLMIGAAFGPSAWAQQAAPPASETERPPITDFAGRLGLPGKIILDSRLRYEHVSQEGLEDGNALTLAGRLGYEIAPIKPLSFLVEMEGVAQLTTDFADTVEFRPGLPVVADPQTLQLNRFHMRYQAPLGLTATIGRQRVIWDDARFVGNVGFRQNEQTFDALYLDWKPDPSLELRYGFLDRINRIFGNDSPVGAFQSNSHIAQLDWKPQPVGAVAAYVLALDFQNSPRNSHLTYGVRWSRPFNLGDWRAKLGLEGARQVDFGENLTEFTVHYAKTLASVGRGPIDVTFTGEWLEGDGVRGFETPLATLHAFQGFADLFLVTPADGLRDFNVSMTWKLPNPPVGQAFSLLVRGHSFTDDDGSALFGREFNALARLKMNAWLTLELRSAVFGGLDPRFADKTRVWLAAEANF